MNAHYTSVLTFNERETDRQREREKLTLTPFIVKATDPYTRRGLGVEEG